MAKTIKPAKNSMIVLSNPELGEVPFERSHAERILAFDAKKQFTTWTLHDNKLIFEDGKIISRASN